MPPGMRRDLAGLVAGRFDVLVVGGGIQGAFLLREAALRGLSATLIERADFGGATSANSLRIVHGGFRCLQRADVRAVREFMTARRNLLRIAPTLVRPLPCLVPTGGRVDRSRVALRAGLLANDLLGIDRNQGVETERRIPTGRLLPREETLRSLPGADLRGCTGGALWHDALMADSERIALLAIRAACAHGAQAANYVEAIGCVVRDGRVCGVRARDVLTGDEFEIGARVTLDATGPWMGQLAAGTGRPHGRAMSLVVRRALPWTVAGGLTLRQDGRERLLFMVPWHGCTLAGVRYEPQSGGPSELQPDEAAVERLIRDVSSVVPGWGLTRSDVSRVHLGLLPATGAVRGGEPVLVRQGRVNEPHVTGLLTVTGVKYTTAWNLAVAALDRAQAQMGHRRAYVYDPVEALPGQSVRVEEPQWPAGVSAENRQRLRVLYGTLLPRVLEHSAILAGAGDLLEGEVAQAIEDEMACTLADVIFRRTGYGAAGLPAGDGLPNCARRMGERLGWSARREAAEIDAVLALDRAWGGRA